MPEEPKTQLSFSSSTELSRSDETLDKITRLREDKWQTLPLAERTFVLSWVEHGSVTTVSEKTGLGIDTVRKKLLDPIIRAAITDYQEYLFDQSLVTKGRIEQETLNLLDMAMGRTPTPMVDSDGQQFEAKAANLTVAKGALEFLGRQHDYGNKSAVEVKGKVTHDWTDAIKQAKAIQAKEPEPAQIEDAEFSEIPVYRIAQDAD